jgi:quinol monooxygenase YgiN
MHGQLAAQSGQRAADTIWVKETWRSKADHDASLTMPGVRELIAKGEALDRRDVRPDT